MFRCFPDFLNVIPSFRLGWIAQRGKVGPEFCCIIARCLFKINLSENTPWVGICRSFTTVRFISNSRQWRSILASWMDFCCFKHWLPSNTFPTCWHLTQMRSSHIRGFDLVLLWMQHLMPVLRELYQIMHGLWLDFECLTGTCDHHSTPLLRNRTSVWTYGTFDLIPNWYQ